MQADQRLTFGLYRFAPQTGQLWRGKHEVSLTRKASSVLHVLLARAGQVVSKEEIFQSVWADTVVSDAALTSCIQELRQALHDHARKPRYIETVHRRGFRFLPAVATAPPMQNAKLRMQNVSAPSPLRSSTQSSALSPQHSVLVGREADLTQLHAWLAKALTGEALALPDKPSIAVMPFTNMSGDPVQEYFSDGLTDDLITDLSRLSQLFVIARHSTFTYKGKAVKVQEVSKELGVRYVLEGSVRKTNEQVRINAQLVDAITGHHIWAERYDRPVQDIFTLQDEIVQKIVTTLKLQLTLQEQGYLVRKHTDHLEAYDSFLRGQEFFWRFTKETNAQARQMFEKALTLDPQYAEAYAWLGTTYYMEWIWRWSPDPQNLERAVEQTQRAIALDDSLPAAHSLLSWGYVQKQQYDQAIAEGERAIALDPNRADSYAWQAEVLNLTGRPEEALKMVKQAMRLNPRYPPWYLFELGFAYRLTGQYTEAVATLKEALSRGPTHLGALTILSFCYVRQWLYQQNTDAQALEQALAAAQRYLTLDDSSPGSHLLLGMVSLSQKQYEQAIAEMKQAIALDLNETWEAWSYVGLANVLSRVGRSEEALWMIEQALGRKHAPVDSHLELVGDAYYLAGRPEEAMALLKKFLSRYPNVLPAHLTLAAVYSELGKEAEARAEAAEVPRLNPNFSLEVHKERVPIKDPAMLERHIAALRKAGLK